MYIKLLDGKSTYYDINFKCLQLFVFELQQNKKNATWEIEWIYPTLNNIWTSNVHKNLIWLWSRHFFFEKGSYTYL